MSILLNLAKLHEDKLGAVAIETAFVVPVLAMLSIGTFEIGSMVSRQQELQSAAGEAESIILAAAAGAGTTSSEIEDVIETSLGLTDEQVVLDQKFRCNTAENLSDSADGCDASQPIYQYVEINLTDSYTPVWTRFNIGERFDFSLTRTVQVS